MRLAMKLLCVPDAVAVCMSERAIRSGSLLVRNWRVGGAILFPNMSGYHHGEQGLGS
jgi:hypothetical protein